MVESRAPKKAAATAGSNVNEASSHSTTSGRARQAQIHEFFTRPSHKRRLKSNSPKKITALDTSAALAMKGSNKLAVGKENHRPGAQHSKALEFGDDARRHVTFPSSQGSEGSSQPMNPKCIDFSSDMSQLSEYDEHEEEHVNCDLDKQYDQSASQSRIDHREDEEDKDEETEMQDDFMTDAVPFGQCSQDSVGRNGWGGFSQMSGRFNTLDGEDEMDFLTPQDQPVFQFSNPNSPSPMKKRVRRNSIEENVNESEEELNHLTQDMDVLDVSHREDQGDWKPNSRVVKTRKFPSVPPSARKAPRSNRSTPPLINKVNGRARISPSKSTLPEVNLNPFDDDQQLFDKSHIVNRRRPVMPSVLSMHGARPSFSRYLLDFVELEMIGSGSFSQVFKCVKRLDGWVYAVKKAKKHFRGKADMQRSLAEVYALAALGHSPHVVRYYNAWIEDDLLYIQLEYCAGNALSTQISTSSRSVKQLDFESDPPSPPPAKQSVSNGSKMDASPELSSEDTLCTILEHIAKALVDVHALSLAHLDVKPSNILVASHGMYKLGDFGTVAKVDSKTEITEGDNRYLSRELLQGNRSHLQAGDIFALGATVYEMARGRQLEGSGDEWQEIRNGHLEKLPRFSNAFQNLISVMMHPDPLQRPRAKQILDHEALVDRYRR